MRRFSLVLLALAMTAALVGTARACTIPVFRYALENWPPDAYQVIVFHDGPIAEEQLCGLEVLPREETLLAEINARLVLVDTSADMEPAHAELLKQIQPPTLPWLAVQYPEKQHVSDLMWHGPLDEPTVAKLLDSPARQEAVRRVLAGESAVWLLLESGDAQADEEAELELRTQLEWLKSILALPEISEDDRRRMKPMDGSNSLPEMMLKFSILRLDRNDPEEELFVRMLTHSEEPLVNMADKPMVFPMFGQGRVLYSIVGKGINRNIIGQTAVDLTGPCSCTIKADNPGWDLLVKTQWSSYLDGRMTPEPEDPELMGMSAFLPAEMQNIPVSANIAAEPIADADAFSVEPSTQDVTVEKAMVTQVPACCPADTPVAVKPTAEPVAVIKSAPPAAVSVNSTEAEPTTPNPTSTLMRNVLLAVGVAGLVLAAALVFMLRRKT